MSTLFSYSDIPLPDRRNAPVPLEASMQHNDPFLYVERQARHLQQNIQSLLDAQSEGLLAGLSGPRNDEAFSNGSSTPTVSGVSSPKGAPTIPVRQPPKKKIGLRAARKGILRSMHELLSVKEEEKRIIAARIQERRDAIREVDTFITKQQGLQKTISDIQNGRDGQRTGELKKEARNLEREIEELEHKLSEMRARYRHVVQEISYTENSVEAKLSSYKNSLSLLESEVRQYLQNPPLEPLPSTPAESSFYSLNPKRRTLEMAREHWRTEQAELRKRQRGVDAEIRALEEGGPVWQSVIAEVSNFEKRLKEEMQRSIGPGSAEARGGNVEEARDRAKKIIEDMDETANRLEEKLDLAEEKNWRLLVCCIGAELEAFKEARAMLLDTFHLSEEENKQTTEVDKNNVKGREGGEAAADDSVSEDHADEPPADLLRDISPSPRHGAMRSEDEDDGPDPAWLLSDT
ncbi:hypothetical protein VTN96DRAFT_3776 [Rasamsonia emersonii]